MGEPRRYQSLVNLQPTYLESITPVLVEKSFISGAMSGFSLRWFLSDLEGIGSSFNIKDDGDSSKNPLLWWLLGLKLSIEHIGVSSKLGLVDWARVDTLLFLRLSKLLGYTVDNWNDRELLLWLRFFDTVCTDIPSSSLKLHSEDVCSTVTTFLSLWQIVSFPIHSLGWSGLNVELVQLNVLILGDDLSDGSEEGLWVVESIDEGNEWLLYWVLLPGIQLVKSVLDII